MHASQISLVQLCVSRGADAFLVKPLGSEEVQHIWQFVKRLTSSDSLSQDSTPEATAKGDLLVGNVDSALAALATERPGRSVVVCSGCASSWPPSAASSGAAAGSSGAAAGSSRIGAGSSSSSGAGAEAGSGPRPTPCTGDVLDEPSIEYDIGGISICDPDIGPRGCGPHAAAAAAVAAATAERMSKCALASGQYARVALPRTADSRRASAERHSHDGPQGGPQPRIDSVPTDEDDPDSVGANCKQQ